MQCQAAGRCDCSPAPASSPCPCVRWGPGNSGSHSNRLAAGYGSEKGGRGEGV